MTAVTFRLPLPPSVNNLFSSRRGGRHASERYRSWTLEACQEVMAQRGSVGGPGQFTGPVKVTIAFGSRAKFDLDNGIKGPLDVMTKMAIWQDDKQVREIHAIYAPIVGCEIRVEKVD